MKSCAIRSSDIVLSTLGLLLFSPIFLIVIFLLWRENKGGVFFRQTRVGQHGIPFTILKFRSMTASEYHLPTKKNDPRITAIGKIIRKTSIDELPQLWNVLKGEMSLVGPRPDLEIQASDYTGEQWRLRNQLKPGITGLAQIGGRSALTVAQRIEKDLQYLQVYSYRTYLKILCLTVFKVIGMKGTN